MLLRNVGAVEGEVVRGGVAIPSNQFFFLKFLHLRIDSEPASGDSLLLGTSLSKVTLCFVFKCIAPAGISLGTGRFTRREAAYENS